MLLTELVGHEDRMHLSQYIDEALFLSSGLPPITTLIRSLSTFLHLEICLIK